MFRKFLEGADERLAGTKTNLSVHMNRTLPPSVLI
jgi:hypothetical protein